MASLSYTTTGQDIGEHVIRVAEQFELNPAKLCGLSTHGDILDRTNVFSTKKIVLLEHEIKL